MSGSSQHSNDSTVANASSSQISVNNMTGGDRNAVVAEQVNRLEAHVDRLIDSLYSTKYIFEKLNVQQLEIDAELTVLSWAVDTKAQKSNPKKYNPKEAMQVFDDWVSAKRL